MEVTKTDIIIMGTLISVYLIGIGVGWFLWNSTINLDTDTYKIDFVSRDEVMKHCDTYDNRTWAYTNQYGRIWIDEALSLQDKKSACVHEVLHNVIYLNSSEENWGESEEHKLINQIQNRIDFKICEAIR